MNLTNILNTQLLTKNILKLTLLETESFTDNYLKLNFMLLRSR